jgi:xanthine/CO dehydrogenase XdhC/CoxF family maturation factor
MVIRVDGSTVGIVSGGCLETDLALHAVQVHESGEPRTVTYDTRGDDEAAWALGLGCNGLIDVLVEPLSPQKVIEVARDLEAELEADTIRLVVCGSGPDAYPLVRMANDLDWLVTVVDHRGVEHAARFPGARVVASLDDVDLDERTAAIVMSHHFERDTEYARALKDSRVSYIGVMGPRARFERMKVQDDERIYAPVGLDVGGRSPEAIALAVTSEVSAVMSERAGGHLRDQPTIHDSRRQAEAGR